LLSYLGMGLMAARAAVLGAGAEGDHPCVAPGSHLTYAYAGKVRLRRFRPSPSGELGYSGLRGALGCWIQVHCTSLPLLLILTFYC
jgi:hypothetical protein